MDGKPEMKKAISILILVLGMSLMGPHALYAGGSTDANISRATNLVGAAASSVYSAKKFSCCNPKGIWCCIEGVLGALQALEMFRGAVNSGSVAKALNNGSYDGLGFDPIKAGFCFEEKNGCTSDDIDSTLKGFKEAFKTGKGYGDEIFKMEKKALAQLAEIEKKGFKIDKKARTITDPKGEVFSLDGAQGLKIPKSLSKIASNKVEGVQSLLNNKKTGQGKAAASAGTSSDGVIFKDEFALNLGNSGALNNKKRKPLGENKKKFLAGLLDKDTKGGVGFSGDDIFKMIQRRYRKKIENKEFLEE